MDYKRIHDKIIEHARSRTLPKDQYKERHHIIPRCMGGTDEPENIVELLAREHYVIHQLLVKMYPNNYALVHAAKLMTTDINGNRVDNRLYEWLKIRLSDITSIRLKQNWKNKEYREKMSAIAKETAKRVWDDKEHRENMSKISAKRWECPKFRKKITEANKEYWSDPKNRKKASKSRKGKNNGSYGKKWYYDPNTLDSIKCKPEDKPEGYIKGRRIHSKPKGANNPKVSIKSGSSSTEKEITSHCIICDKETGSALAKYCSEHRRTNRNLYDQKKKEENKKLHQELYEIYIENTFVDFCKITGYNKSQSTLCCAFKRYIDDYETKYTLNKRKK